MKKKQTKKQPQIVEIHIYVHQVNPSGDSLTILPKCTCNNATLIPCPIHGAYRQKQNYPITYC